MQPSDVPSTPHVVASGRYSVSQLSPVVSSSEFDYGNLSSAPNGQYTFGRCPPATKRGTRVVDQLPVFVFCVEVETLVRRVHDSVFDTAPMSEHWFENATVRSTANNHSLRHHPICPSLHLYIVCRYIQFVSSSLLESLSEVAAIRVAAGGLTLSSHLDALYHVGGVVRGAIHSRRNRVGRQFVVGVGAEE